MKKLEEVLNNIKTGNKFVIRKDKNNKIYGAELRYDGNIEKDTYLVDIKKFIKEFPNLVKQINKDMIYHLAYNRINKKYESVLIDKENNIIDSSSNEDLYEAALDLENKYTCLVGRVLRKLKNRKVS